MGGFFGVLVSLLTLCPPPNQGCTPRFQTTQSLSRQRTLPARYTDGFTTPGESWVLWGGFSGALLFPLTLCPLPRFDLAPHAAVTEEDVRAFEGKWGLRVLRAGGTPGAGGARAGLARVAPVLDALVEGLWRRDQVTAGVTPGDTGDTPT